MNFGETAIVELAQLAAHNAAVRLQRAGIDQIAALESAKDAGDAFAQALDRALREHGVKIIRRV